LQLRQKEHIPGHLWQRYSVTVNQVMVATVKLLKWLLQFKDWESLVSLLVASGYTVELLKQTEQSRRDTHIKNETVRWKRISQISHCELSIYICSNIQAAVAYGIYISGLICNFRACGSYHDFLDNRMLLTRKLRIPSP
jgi:hypothetical protein